MLFFLICAAFALFPELVLSGAGNGLSLCLDVVIPSLLPFMLVSSCLIKSGFSRPLGALLSKIITPITGISTPGCVCFVTGLVGGYGAGARAISESYREKLVSKEEAERLLAFCNNAGPLFVIGTVGVGFYSSKTIGIMLFFVQIITSVICARIFGKNFGGKSTVREEWIEYRKHKPRTGELVSVSAIESGSAIITACVFVISFCALLEVLPFGQYSIFSGIMEVIRGCSEMAMRGGDSLALTSAFLAWGGFSVHLQANALTSGIFDMKKYYIGKSVAALIAYFLTKITGGDMNILALMTLSFVSVVLVYNTVKNLFCPESPRQLLFRQRRRS